MFTVERQTARLLTYKDPLEMAEYAARICYDSTDKMKPGSAEPLIRALIKRGHFTPLEHAYVRLYPNRVRDAGNRFYVNGLYAFAASGDYPFADRRLTRGSFYRGEDDNGQYVAGNLRDIHWYLSQHCDAIDIIKEAAELAPDYAVLELITDRGIATEFFRHRTMSYDDNGALSLAVDFVQEPAINQQSTRYVNFDKKNAFLILPEPAEWAYDHTKWEYLMWYQSCKMSMQYYLDMVMNGMPPEYARNVLPLSLGTKVVMSGSLINWLYVLNLRLPKGAHPQARLLASYIWDILKVNYASYINKWIENGKLDKQFDLADLNKEAADIQALVKPIKEIES